MGKFKSMIHAGVVFPPEYETKGFRLANEPLSSLAEEMMWHYSAKRDTDYVKIQRFNENFYKCLKPELTVQQQKLSFPKDFEKLINEMFAESQRLKELKKASEPKKPTKKELELAKNDAKLLKSVLDRKNRYEAKAQEKEAMKEKYGYAILDGRKEPLGSYMIEPPGIIMTRGDSSIIGMWKYRTVPEDVVINFVDPTKKEKVPVPPEGHRWKDVIADTNSCQTAMYFVQVGRPEFGITPRYKRVIFAATSSVKTDKDKLKFEKARKLVQNWEGMEKHIKLGMLDKNKKRFEAAVIASLIKTTGIRVGNEKNEEDGYANTCGASTLEVGNIELLNDNKIKLDFIGKDSIHYVNTVELDLLTYKSLKSIIGTRPKNELLFKNASSIDVSNFLKEFMSECSPKLFRSAYGCKLIAEELHKAEASGKLKKSMSLAKKLEVYDDANLAVAKKLNHQRALPKNFDAQMEKLDKQIEEAIAKETETKKKAEADLKKILERANLAKKEWEGDKLKQALARIKERKEKIAARVEKSEAKIEALKTKKSTKTKTANFALGTSKSAYSTPSLAIAFCKKFEVPFEKMYSKSLLAKFSWALDVPESYYDNFPNEEY